MNPAAILAELEAERSRVDQAIAAIRPLVGSAPPPPVVAAPKDRSRPKKQTGWKQRRRCQNPKCLQQTWTDPCEHCGAAIAPAGARDLGK